MLNKSTMTRMLANNVGTSAWTRKQAIYASLLHDSHAETDVYTLIHACYAETCIFARSQYRLRFMSV
jgi:hypothetical protein